MPEYVTGSEENSAYPDLPKATREYLREGAAVGSRDNGLFGAACQFRDSGYSQADAETPLIDRAVRDGLNEAYAKRKIASAYSQSPRGPANNAHASDTAPPPNQSKTRSASAFVLPSPIPNGFRMLLETCFLEGEGVAIGQGRIEGGDLKIDGGSVLRRERWLAKGPPPINKTGEGVFVRVNPLKAGGKNDRDVTAHRHALVEFDRAADGRPVPKEAQYQALIESGFPISAIIDGGNISLQALVRLDAGNRREFNERWKLVSDHFQNVEGFDPSTKNPSRYCRLPGVTRRIEGGAIGYQELLAINVGAASWKEWEKGEAQPRGYSEEEQQRLRAEALEFYRSKNRPLPLPMAEAAYHGIAGKIVGIIAAASEPCRESLLAQFLVGFGSIMGRNLYCNQGSDHHLNEFVVLVGETAFGRKGTAWNAIRNLLKEVDPVWVKTRTFEGVQSGEAIIHEIRDPRQKLTRGGKMVHDPGVSDKRLGIVEQEFGRVLVVGGREGNTLSVTLRKCWDSEDDLHTGSKNNPERATNPHVSLIGHVTVEELRKMLDQIDSVNGFSNRIMWLVVKRTKVIACPPPISWKQYPAILQKLRDIKANLTSHSRSLSWEKEALLEWKRYYETKKDSGAGMLGPIIARSAPHVLRLAMLYAVLDASTLIELKHLQAALAFVDYCERCAQWIFQERTGNKTADKILWNLERRPAGMIRSEIQREVFSNHCSETTLNMALSLLVNMDLTEVSHERGSNNKTVERWKTKGVNIAL